MHRVIVQILASTLLVHAFGSSEAQDVFQAPTWTSPQTEHLLPEKRNAVEGWVAVSLIVNSAGEPEEAMIIGSNHNQLLEQEALKSIDAWRFTPAMLDGKPIASAFETKLRYVLSPSRSNSMTAAMTSAFAKAYYELIGEIEAGDRRAADRALAKLRPANLHEDAHFGLAQFAYARQWGTEAEQLAGLERAVAFEQTAIYLSPSQFLSALTSLLPLQANARDFVGALKTWETLQKLHPDAEVLAKLKPVVAQVEAFREERQPYNVSGELVDGSWHINLFRKDFGLVVSEGRISQLKLRCERRFATLTFDPKNSYKVPDKFGTCRLQVIGDPGTKFRLIQS